MYITKEFDSMSIDRYTQFICKRRCGDEQIHTHLDMFEGKYCITTKNNDHSTFLRLRAAAIDAGYKDCITEIATPEHIFHADIDAHVPTDIEFDYIGFARALQLTLQQQPEVHVSNTTLIILTAPSANEEEGVKHGMHIIAPYIKCSFDYEKGVREASFERFQEILDRISPNKKLYAADIYDPAPYTGKTGSGLRMAYSYKTKKLDDGTKELVNRRYTVYAVLNPNGTIHEKQTASFKSSTLLTIQRCTIRSYAKSINYVKKRKRDVPTIGSISTEKGKKIFEYAAQIDTIFSHPVVKDTMQYDHPNPKYAGHILKLDETYCPHMQKKHKQSTIYIKYNLFACVTAGCYCKKYTCHKWKPECIPTDMETAKEYNLLGKDNIPLGFF
ncbi:hypothetical protein ENVG_00352 [Emiliania huxleyi virus 84]|nr:hypothetical protein ENVG_00352 [Emiliania huxleyi virus 84]AEP15070.1 hypothetical protein EOVG_00133 [Emiliania huxleyi virus 88]